MRGSDRVVHGRADVCALALHDCPLQGASCPLDGYPSLLWLKEGAHRVQLYKGGYVTFDEPIDVQAGQQQELKVRLDKGESAPPGVRPERRKTSVS